jgi:glycosyltransferase involved in cell wall biosynthesis
MNFTVAIMCKNEAERILHTLYSIKNFVDILYVYDTGSTDTTIARIRKFCEKYSIELHLKGGQFVDFATSRNVLLDFMKEDTAVTWILLMDANDILNGDEKLKGFISRIDENARTSYLMSQRVQMKDDYTAQHYNVKLLKNGCGYYFKRKIHEVLYNDDKTQLNPDKIPDDIFLFQNRLKDTGSIDRFYRDYEILVDNYKKNRNNPNRDELDFQRDLFYTGQTCICIFESEKQKVWLTRAHQYYSLRASFKDAPFKEETWNSMMSIVMIYQGLEKPWNDIRMLLMDAWEFMPSRIESVLLLAQHYYIEKNFIVAFAFSNFSCRPVTPDVVMSLNNKIWGYDRWRIHALICYHLGSNSKDLFFAGVESLEVAIEGGKKLGYENPLDIELLELFKVHENQFKVETNMELKTM